MAREINTVGVVGLGTMGAGIVEVSARNGIDVVAVEIGEVALELGRSTGAVVVNNNVNAEAATASTTAAPRIR